MTDDLLPDPVVEEAERKAAREAEKAARAAIRKDWLDGERAKYKKPKHRQPTTRGKGLGGVRLRRPPDL